MRKRQLKKFLKKVGAWDSDAVVIGGSKWLSRYSYHSFKRLTPVNIISVANEYDLHNGYEVTDGKLEQSLFGHDLIVNKWRKQK